MKRQVRNTADCYESLSKWLSLATPYDWQQGKQWYGKAREWVETKSQKYRIPANVVAGTIAVLSPGCKWERNLTDAERVIHAHITQDNMPLVQTYMANSRKAAILLDYWHSMGEYNESLDDNEILRYIGSENALKCRNFYLAILYPRSWYTCVVDRHMIRAAGLDAKSCSKEQYNSIRQAIYELAHEHNTTPNAIQATIWLLVRAGGNPVQPKLW